MLDEGDVVNVMSVIDPPWRGDKSSRLVYVGYGYYESYSSEELARNRSNYKLESVHKLRTVPRKTGLQVSPLTLTRTGTAMHLEHDRSEPTLSVRGSDCSALSWDVLRRANNMCLSSPNFMWRAEASRPPPVPASCICAATPYKTPLIIPPTTAQYPSQPRLTADYRPPSHPYPPNTRASLKYPASRPLVLYRFSDTPDNASHFGGSLCLLWYCYRRSDSRLRLRTTSRLFPSFPKRTLQSVSHRQSTSLKTNNVERPIAMSRPHPKNDPSSASSTTRMSTILTPKSSPGR